MKKILNEWRKYSLNEGRALAGLEDNAGVLDGTLENFGNVFTTGAYINKIAAWAQKQITPDQIYEIVDQAINSEKIRPEQKEAAVKGLKTGWTYWWSILLGPREAENLVDYQVSIWKELMEKKLSEQDENSFNELKYFSEKLKDFFKEHVSRVGSSGVSSVSNLGTYDNSQKGKTRISLHAEQPAGLYGQLQDWFLGRPEGMYTKFLSSMQTAVTDLVSKYPQVDNVPMPDREQPEPAAPENITGASDRNAEIMARMAAFFNEQPPPKKRRRKK